MQIFYLDKDISKCASYHADKHVIKQILESCQLLCTTMRMHGIDYGYRKTHMNHPLRLWTEKSRDNFLWLKKLGAALCEEYSFRYNKVHKTEDILINTFPPRCIPDIGLTPFALAMPDEYKSDDAVKSYRDYYINEKKHLLTYTKRTPPQWLEGLAKQK